MMLTAAVATDSDLIPPLEDLTAQFDGVSGASRAISTYTGNLDKIATGDSTLSDAGMTITLPNPFQDSPVALAAILRAKNRTSSYTQGLSSYSHWVLQTMMYSMSFGSLADRLTTIYEQVAPSGPTDAQRAEVRKIFAELINPLEGGRQQITRAATEFLAVRTLLEEDRASIGQGVPVIDEALARFQQKVTDLAIKYSLYPTTRGLVPILAKASNAQLTHLRSAREALGTVMVDCERASTSVSRIAGHLLNLVNKYRGLEQTLNQAQGAAFKSAMQNLKISMARDKWAAFLAYLHKYLGGG